jgi:hypothetical protein
MWAFTLLPTRRRFYRVDSVPNRTAESANVSSRGAISQLRSMGVDVFDSQTQTALDWDRCVWTAGRYLDECMIARACSLAGYDEVKRQVQDTIVNALTHPNTYDNIARQTRERRALYTLLQAWC